jgi:hypothetical protein
MKKKYTDFSEKNFLTFFMISITLLEFAKRLLPNNSKTGLSSVDNLSRDRIKYVGSGKEFE